MLTCSLHAETAEPFRGNTVRAAAALQQNGVLGSLLAVVATVRRCHSGEAFVRLKVGAAAWPAICKCGVLLGFSSYGCSVQGCSGRQPLP